MKSIFISQRLRLQISEFLTVLFNQFEILAGNIVLVLLHLSESLFVVVHQFINVLIFALLNLMDFNFHSQVQLSLQLPEFLFVVVD